MYRRGNASVNATEGTDLEGRGERSSELRETKCASYILI